MTTKATVSYARDPNTLTLRPPPWAQSVTAHTMMDLSWQRGLLNIVHARRLSARGEVEVVRHLLIQLAMQLRWPMLRPSVAILALSKLRSSSIVLMPFRVSLSHPRWSTG